MGYVHSYHQVKSVPNDQWLLLTTMVANVFLLAQNRYVPGFLTQWSFALLTANIRYLNLVNCSLKDSMANRRLRSTVKSAWTRHMKLFTSASIHRAAVSVKPRSFGNHADHTISWSKQRC
ncbi:hypothetical protein [Pantoea dispersa]|uniref:hypothetical protein n=1 Tax=Pantoea dispersa TaxID=59814 RepID=UPI0022228AB9|nr:hypothetical protein [Pantoea dispersa]UYV56935.1 hypothetical protein OH655_16035 [Pantoea dispersa]